MFLAAQVFENLCRLHIEIHPVLLSIRGLLRVDPFAARIRGERAICNTVATFDLIRPTSRPLLLPAHSIKGSRIAAFILKRSHGRRKLAHTFKPTVQGALVLPLLHHDGHAMVR